MSGSTGWSQSLGRRGHRARGAARRRAWLALLVLGFGQACGEGTTGSDRFELSVALRGASAAGTATETQLGYEVVLDRAELWVGAVYVNELAPVAGSQQLPCILPGLYTLEATQGRWVDVLDTTPQTLPVPGRAVGEPGRMVELWLSSEGVAIDAPDDAAIIAEYAGRARRGALEWEFQGEVSIGRQRRIADPDPNRPGANPICKERIVRGIEADFVPQRGGELTIVVDPLEWFREVDFAADAPQGGSFELADDNATQTGFGVFRGLGSSAAYEAEWRRDP